MRDRFRKWFALSPISQRREVTGRVGRWLDPAGKMHQSDERFLAVLIARNSFAVSALVGLALLVLIAYGNLIAGIQFATDKSVVFGLNLKELGFVGFHAYYHAQIMGWVIFVSAVLYLLLFVIHVRREDVDLFRDHSILKYKQSRTPANKAKAYVLYSFCILLAYLSSFLSYALIIAIMVRFGIESLLSESYLYLLFSYGVLVVGHASGAMLLYAAVVLIYGLLAGFDKYGGLELPNR